ncbi:hypothetical protein SAMN05444354_1232 [Stigmatella aurantiaca]|uniref:Uncharacterized protein n=1 Tax=Stigmatella aurantiaca TaxID=41 RepID=A0A1H8B5J0_STIAU|nr:hypothetical protein [Stigmatella aurantiaca]SEM78152.1 hypothetical protein SAMN05444354_1232 [Stigmatella aurantiaca]
MGMQQKAVWMLILMLSPWMGFAEENPKLQSYLRSVNSLYESFEYEQALKQLERAQRFSRTMEEDVALSLYEGIILADMSRWDASAAAFRAALSLQPEASLPLKVSPKIGAYFEKVRQEVMREQAIAASKEPVGVRPEPPPVGTQGAVAPAPEVLNKESPTPLSVDAQSTVTAEPAGSRWRRAEVLAPAITGGVLVLAGGASWILSRREASLLEGEGERFSSREDVHRSASRGKTYQSVGAGLLGAGVVGLGIAAGLYFWSPTEETKLGVFSNGTSAVIYGRWQ